MSYYNTTSLTTIDLQTATGKAKAQDTKIFDFFKENAGKLFTPDEIHNLIFRDNVPLTSVRRSINTLTKESLLEKTDVYKQGSYGKMVHCWKLNSSAQLKLL